MGGINFPGVWISRLEGKSIFSGLLKVSVIGFALFSISDQIRSGGQFDE